jgi:co-chaperonin GroES (HSP10)
MIMINKSGLKPLGRAVLLEPYEPEFNKSMIAIPDHVRSRELMGEMRGVVVAVGEHCWPDEPARAKPGDKVLASKYSGAIVKGTADGKLYRVCNDEDLFCGLEAGDLADVLIEDPVPVRTAIGR